MSTPTTDAEAVLLVAVLDALSAEVAKELKKARAGAEVILKDTGQLHPQVNVRLPGGRTVGRITVKEGAPRADLEPGALLEWCRTHFPAAIEEYIPESAWSAVDVIEAVKAKIPGIVKERVRPAAEAELVKELLADNGQLAGRRTGDDSKVKLADVYEGRITGEFAFTDQKTAERRSAIMAAYRSGELRGLPLGMLALPAGDGGE